MNPVENLRDQMADVLELDESRLTAADDAWAEHGRDAAALYCLGA